MYYESIRFESMIYRISNILSFLFNIREILFFNWNKQKKKKNCNKIIHFIQNNLIKQNKKDKIIRTNINEIDPQQCFAK